jgi:hypothetical protein
MLPLTASSLAQQDEAAVLSRKITELSAAGRFNAEEEGGQRDAQGRSIVATRSYSEFWKGVEIDRTMLSHALPLLSQKDADQNQKQKGMERSGQLGG